MKKTITKLRETGYISGLFAKWWERKHRIIEEIILVGVLAIVLFGIGLTDASPTKSYHYWVWMIVVFALGGLVVGAIKAHHNKQSVLEIALDQLVHWGATLAAVFVVYLMLGAGRLTYEPTGLVILLLLGLAMFLDGYYRVGWRFSALGILVILLDLGTAYLSTYIWFVLILGAALWPLSILVEVYMTHKRDLKKQA